MLTTSLQKKIILSYTKNCLSSAQIANKFCISESTVNYYLHKNKVQKRTITDAINCIYITRFGKKGFKVKEILSSKEEKLKVAGAMLYWGEGTKRGSGVHLSNSDPEMIKLFLKFLRKICGVAEERLRILIYRYPDQDENNLRKFWSKTTRVPIQQFQQVSIQKGKPGTYTKKSKYGTISVRYSDKRLLGTILSWMREYQETL